MDAAALTEILQAVRAGTLSPDDAVARLRRLPFTDLDYARVDHHRELRQGLAEVVYGPGKSVEQVVAIVGELLEGGASPVLLTRASPVQTAAVVRSCPGGQVSGSTVAWRPAPTRDEQVLVVTAGTADLPVADECAATLLACGLPPTRLTDVGVAGLHRLLDQVESVQSADVVIVVAGMEGALASVVAGLTPAPVVAVPTSVGYGASLEGVTALLAMLASCAAGMVVVGIDNGFGAAAAALRILGARGR